MKKIFRKAASWLSLLALPFMLNSTAKAQQPNQAIEERENWFVYYANDHQYKANTQKCHEELEEIFNELTSNNIVKPENFYVHVPRPDTTVIGNVPISGDATYASLDSSINEIAAIMETNGKWNVVLGPMLLTNGYGKFDKDSQSSFKGYTYVNGLVTPTESPIFDNDLLESEDYTESLVVYGGSQRNVGLDMPWINWSLGENGDPAKGIVYTATPDRVKLPGHLVLHDPDTTATKKLIYKIEYLLKPEFDSDRDGRVDPAKRADFLDKVLNDSSHTALISDEAIKAEIYGFDVDKNQNNFNDIIFAFKKNGSYKAAIAVDMGDVDLNTLNLEDLQVNGLDEDNQGGFKGVDWNRNEIDDVVHYQWKSGIEIYPISPIDIEVAELFQKLKDHAKVVIPLIGSDFGGDFLDNFYGDGIAAFSLAPHNDWLMYQNDLPNMFLNSIKKTGDYFDIDTNTDGAVTALELINKFAAIGPRKFTYPITGTKLTYNANMCVNADGDREYTLLNNLAGSSDETGLANLILWTYEIPVTGVDGEDHQMPKNFLYQNYPNPFNNTTKLMFETSKSGAAKLEIYNTAGQRIKTVFDKYVQPGKHQATWDGTDRAGSHVASGIYTSKLTSPNGVKTKRMVLIK